MESVISALILVVFVVLVVALIVFLLGRVIKPVTVHEHERGLRYRSGAFRSLVGPGVHWTVPPFSEIRTVDSRPTDLTIEGQEVLTADGVAVKLSFVARYGVGDPVAMALADQNPLRALYLRLQLGIREVVSSQTLDEILAARTEIGPAVAERCAGRVTELGLDLLSMEVRDVMIPGELKRAFAGVIAARKDGAAALERARGETAALRSLANAGRMMDDNPGLLSLRVIQEIGASSGNTIVFGVPDAAGVRSVEPHASAPAPRARPARPGRPPGGPPVSDG